MMMGKVISLSRKSAVELMLLADELFTGVHVLYLGQPIRAAQCLPLEERSENLGMALTAFKGPSHRSERHPRVRQLRQPAMGQTLENPEYLKEFCDQSTKRGPWDFTRISGHPGGGLQNPPFLDSGNPTSKHGRSLASYKGSARSTDELKQSSSFDSACGATTSTSNGFRERQDFTSTIPTTPSEASFGNETYLARKAHDLDLSGSKSEDCEGSLAEEVQSVVGPCHQILEGLGPERDRSVQPETGSQELGLAKVFEEIAGGHDRSLQPKTWSQDPVNPRPLGWTAAKQDTSLQSRNWGREPLYQRLLRWAGREHKYLLQPEAPGRGRLRRAARSVLNFLVHQDVISSATAVSQEPHSYLIIVRGIDSYHAGLQPRYPNCRPQLQIHARFCSPRHTVSAWQLDIQTSCGTVRQAA